MTHTQGIKASMSHGLHTLTTIETNTRYVIRQFMFRCAIMQWSHNSPVLYSNFYQPQSAKRKYIRLRPGGN